MNYIKYLQKEEGNTLMETTVRKRDGSFICTKFRHEKLGPQTNCFGKNYVYFRRTYEKGCPWLEEEFSENKKLKPFRTPFPIYDGAQPETGLCVSLSGSGFMEFGIGKNLYPKNKYLFREHGIYSLGEVKCSYHTKFSDCEPHAYRAESELCVYTRKGPVLNKPAYFSTLSEVGLDLAKCQEKEMFYKIKYFRDGKKAGVEISPLQCFFSRKKRNVTEYCGDGEYREEMFFRLFSMMEDNIEFLKEEREKKSTLCACSYTGRNNTFKDAEQHISNYYFNGNSIFKVCATCGAHEKLI